MNSHNTITNKIKLKPSSDSLKQYLKRRKNNAVPNMNVPVPCKYICPICSAYTVKIEKMQFHLKSKHNWSKNSIKELLHGVTKKFQCNFCKLSFKTKDLLETHIEIELFKLEKPKTSTVRKILPKPSLKEIEEANKLKIDTYIANHFKNVITIENKYLYYCPICNCTKYLDTDIKTHMKTSHPDSNNLNLRIPWKITEVWSCNLCTVICYCPYVNFESYVEHFKSKHESWFTKRFKVCTNEQGNVFVELLHDESIESKKFQCSFCKLLFKTKELLETHIEIEVFKLKNPKLNIVHKVLPKPPPKINKKLEEEKKLKNELYMADQFKNVITIENKYLYHCSNCNYKTYLNSDIKTHMKTKHPNASNKRTPWKLGEVWSCNLCIKTLLCYCPNVNFESYIKHFKSKHESWFAERFKVCSTEQVNDLVDSELLLCKIDVQDEEMELFPERDIQGTENIYNGAKPPEFCSVNKQADSIFGGYVVVKEEVFDDDMEY